MKRQPILDSKEDKIIDEAIKYSLERQRGVEALQNLRRTNVFYQGFGGDISNIDDVQKYFIIRFGDSNVVQQMIESIRERDAALGNQKP